METTITLITDKPIKHRLKVKLSKMEREFGDYVYNNPLPFQPLNRSANIIYFEVDCINMDDIRKILHLRHIEFVVKEEVRKIVSASGIETKH